MLERHNTAVVMIEFQNDWISPSGKINHLMQDRDHFAAAIAGGKRLLSLARQEGLKVAHCGLSYQEGHPELGIDGWGLRGVIPKVTTFTRGSDGCKFAEGFEPQAGEFVVTGRTGSSGFAGSNLDVYLRGQRITHLLIAGFATNVCLSSTLRQGHDLGYNMVVVEDAAACFTKEQHDFEMKHVVHHFGKHMTVEQLADQFRPRAA